MENGKDYSIDDFNRRARVQEVVLFCTSRKNLLTS
jgi:hypothetical protein